MGGKRLLRRPLTIREILSWADAYREATGKWPTKDSGDIFATKFENWRNVNQALRDGLRGLPGGSSLAQLLVEKRNAHKTRLLALTYEQILNWADEHHKRTARWPVRSSGIIPNTGGERWTNIDWALRHGARGLPDGSCLAALLLKDRGVRHRGQLSPLTEKQILQWADAHFERTGTWPTGKSGPISEAPGETWTAVQMALVKGHRGLPGGSSLAILLAERRKVRNIWTRPDLSIKQILAWADAFHEGTGEWPDATSGPVLGVDGETWNAINHALMRRSRGLRSGLSLAELLSQERGVRNHRNLPRLSQKQILAWADTHRRRTGEWPTKNSGSVAESPADSWQAIDVALYQGCRGLPGGASLPRLLARFRKRKNYLDQPRLSQRKILAWADAHFQRTGTWPNVNTGKVRGVPGERWYLINVALREGFRGLPGGSSLLKLFAKKRGARNRVNRPPLTEKEILRWADRHHECTGSWPRNGSGPIASAPGETWDGIDRGLSQGKRGLAGGSSLAKLLAARRNGQ